MFFLLVLHCSIRPVSLDPSRPHADILRLEDGSFDAGYVWQPLRRLNGDETAIMRYEEPVLLCIRLLQYE